MIKLFPAANINSCPPDLEELVGAEKQKLNAASLSLAPVGVNRSLMSGGCFYAPDLTSGPEM